MGSYGGISSTRRTVYCKTIDGIELEGWFYEAEGPPAPAIVMVQGFCLPKELWVGEKAEILHSRGYNVLVYDPRSVGGSGGVPRAQVDPWRMVEDVSDVVSWIKGHPSVDEKRIVIWGVSLGATVGAVAAALDRRVAGLVMVCPMFSMVRPDRRAKAFAILMRDRESQLRGNKPVMAPPYNSSGDNIIGYAGAGGAGGREGYRLWQDAVNAAPTFPPQITLQSWYKIAQFRPCEILEEMLEGIPTMMMVAGKDDIAPPQEQSAVFDKLKTPKRLFWGGGYGHLNIVSREAGDVWKAMFDFFDDILDR
ncbi:Alpha/Beta hydrolase protein [Diaporthe sp. PMI_573]|nr:Alpha/Beta hydrolase protein [Diaporthaceae sp. PMI_573]